MEEAMIQRTQMVQGCHLGLKGSPEPRVPYQICRVEFLVLSSVGQCGGGTWRLLSTQGPKAKVAPGLRLVGLKEFGG